MISRAITILTLCLSIAGCNAEPLANVTFPLLKSCESFIAEYSQHKKEAANSKSYEISVHVNRFDRVPLSHLALSGAVTLELKGDFNPIDPISPEDYLITQINSILMHCAPETSREFFLQGDKIASSLNIFNFAKEHQATHLERTENGIKVYYNDGSYKYPLPNK